MNRKPKPNTSVSWGTLRDKDILETLLSVLEEYRPRKYKSIIAEGLDLLETIKDDERLGVPTVNQDNLSWFMNETLWDACNELAPKGCYFGAHPGDGSNFGFWQFEE